MRKLVATAVAMTFSVGGVAFADDMMAADQCFDKATLSYVDCPTYEPAPVLPSWSGPYVGVHAGYFEPFFDNEFDDGAVLFFDDIEAGGVMAGGQLGFLHQFEDNIVVGAEISGSYVGGEGSATDGGGDFADAGIDWVAEARLRLGYAIYEGGLPILPYVTGGVALAGYEATILDDAGPTTLNIDETALGGVVGGGLEVMLDPSISAGVEGLYYFFDESNAMPFGAADDSFDLDGAWAVRAKLNFHF